MMESEKASLGDRIRSRRKTLRMSQKRLAQEVTKRGMNLSQQNVNSIESGLVARPRAIPEIAAVLQTTIEWLQKGQGPEEFGTPERPRRSVRPGYFHLLQSAHTREPYIMELIPAHPDHGKVIDVGRPYSFYMSGSEMSPVIEHGDEIGAYPALAPDYDVDCVFLQEEVGGKRLATVGRLISTIKNEWIAKHFNPEQHVRLPRPKWVAAHPIVQIRRSWALKKTNQ